MGGRYEALGDAFNGPTIAVLTGADDIPGPAAKLGAKLPEKNRNE